MLISTAAGLRSCLGWGACRCHWPPGALRGVCKARREPAEHEGGQPTSRRPLHSTQQTGPHGPVQRPPSGGRSAAEA
eukprot:9513661-Alexandrium_andersonii.AAC.1